MFTTIRKCLSLLDRGTKWQAVLVAGLVMLGALLEAAGISLIFPFIKIVMDPTLLRDMPWLSRVIGDTPDGGETRALVALAGALLTLFVFKNLSLAGIYYTQRRFVAANEMALASKLLVYYLNGDYLLHLSRNSAGLIQNINNTTSAVFSGAFMGFVTVVSELCLVSAITVVLLIAEPALTVGAMLTLIAAVGAYYGLMRRKFMVWGQMNLAANRGTLQSLQEGFHNIKMVKAHGIESHVLDAFLIPRNVLRHVRVMMGTASELPRLWLETVMVAVVMSVVIMIVARGGNSTEVMAALGLFAAAAFRIMPSANRILQAFNNIKNSQEPVKVICQDIEFFSRADGGVKNFLDSHAQLMFKTSILLDRVSFNYPDADVPAVKDLTCEIKKGESIGLAGSSGAGKTTLVDIILGLLQPTEGRVIVDGADISANTRAWQRQIGYVPQMIYLTDDTLRRNIALGISEGKIDEGRILEVLKLAHLDQFAESLPKGVHSNVGEHGVRLSGGQRQRIGIARALYNDPQVLILDEATSALDNETEHEISRAIDELGGSKTLIVVAHRLSTIRKCDHIIFMDGGRVADVGNYQYLSENNVKFRTLVELMTL